MDVLAEILGSLRLTGGVVIDGVLTSDFCLRAEFTPGHCAPFFPLPERLVSYHYVRSGHLVIEMESGGPQEVTAGCIVILPRNDHHLLASRAGLAPADVNEIGWVTAEGVHRVTCGRGGEETKIWCGFLGTARERAHPLLDALPPLLILDMRNGLGDWVDSSMRFVAEQHPTPEIVARLAELLLAQAVREYIDKNPETTGWLAALKDPAIARALSVIHARYAEELSVDELAREAGVSRTVLGERFVDLLGEPPIRYSARWRMRMAANMLRETSETSATIAYKVGFNAEAAFNRAFKREYGEPPAKWRKHA